MAGSPEELPATGSPGASRGRAGPASQHRAQYEMAGSPEELPATGSPGASRGGLAASTARY